MAALPIKRTVFVTEPDRSFGSGVNSWQVLDLDRIRSMIGASGYETEAVRIDRLLDFPARDTDVLFYTSAFSEALRRYTQEILYFVRQRARIAPGYELLLAHENKGVQELLRRELQFGNLGGGYHVDFDERPLSPPYVFKTVSGAGSSGVALVRNAADEERIRRLYFSTPLSRRLKLLLRRFKLKNEQQLRRYAYYYKSFMPFVAQEFVQGLARDLKIIVFGDRYYTLWRKNRPNDFRASGSGLLDFDTPCPLHVLDFARAVASSLDTPFVSLDIAETDGRCHLIEFQALNMGPTTVTGSNGYYVHANQSWKRVQAPADLEDAYVHGMLRYLEKAGRNG